MLAWHFLPKNKRLGHGDGRLVEAGKTLECEGEPALGKNGMHGSVRLIDALRYASGPVVCRVEIDGDVIEDTDKLCGRRRTVLWMLDATNILHEFACACTEDALTRVAYPDPRSLAGIAAKRAWLRGEITDAELDSAWAEAWHAVDGAWGVARDAAYAAAWATSRDDAEDVALDAAWSARDKQNARLTEMVMAAHELEEVK